MSPRVTRTTKTAPLPKDRTVHHSVQVFGGKDSHGKTLTQGDKVEVEGIGTMKFISLIEYHDDRPSVVNLAGPRNEARTVYPDRVTFHVHRSGDYRIPTGEII